MDTHTKISSCTQKTELGNSEIAIAESAPSANQTVVTLTVQSSTIINPTVIINQKIHIFSTFITSLILCYHTFK